MSYRPYKFLIAPVIQEVDEQGQVISELSVEKPVVVFGLSGLKAYAEAFEQDLIARVAEMDGNVE